jgi:hypothetical protein
MAKTEFDNRILSRQRNNASKAPTRVALNYTPAYRDNNGTVMIRPYRTTHRITQTTQRVASSHNYQDNAGMNYSYESWVTDVQMNISTSDDARRGLLPGSRSVVMHTFVTNDSAPLSNTSSVPIVKLCSSLLCYRLSKAAGFLLRRLQPLHSGCYSTISTIV